MTLKRRAVSTEAGDQPPPRRSAAVALAPALRPVVDLCLQLGITSPEMERILRSVFVERAADSLSGVSGRGGPSDVRIGLMIGVDRNLVRKIRTTKRPDQLRNVQRRHRITALLEAWATDWRFLNSAGHPRDLAIQDADGEASLSMLVRQYMPAVSTGTAIAELRRAGVIRLLPDERVRLRSRTPRPTGFTESSVSTVGERLAELASTLLSNLGSPGEQRLFERIEPLWIDAQRLPLARLTLAKRTRTFLDSLSAELANEAVGPASGSKVLIGLTVFSSEDAQQPGRLRSSRGKRS